MIERDKAPTFHMGVSKSFLFRVLEERSDWRSFLVDWKGTKEEAQHALEEDPRSVFCSCACEKNEDGSCKGKGVR